MSLIKINKNTQRAQAIIRAWQRSEIGSLWQAYETCSDAKARAYEYCLSLMRELDGSHGRVTGHNCFYFSYAFKRGDDLIYITHGGDYIIPNAFGTHRVNE